METNRALLCLVASMPLAGAAIMTIRYGGTLIPPSPAIIIGAVILAAALLWAVGGKRVGQVAGVLAGLVLVGIVWWEATLSDLSDLNALTNFPSLGWWSVPAAAVAAAALGRWHYSSGRAFGTPAKRAELWEKRRHKWAFNTNTGEWNRISIDAGSNIGQTVAAPTRDKRTILEIYYFQMRVAASIAAHFFAVLFLLLALHDYAKHLQGYDNEAYSALFLFSALCESFVWLEEWLYRTGRPCWYDPETKTWAAGAMVLDPPRSRPTTEPFGASIPTSQPAPRAVSDNYQIPL